MFAAAFVVAVMQGARRIGWSLADDAVGNHTETQTASLSGIPLPAPADDDSWNPVPLVCVAAAALVVACVGVILVLKRRCVRRRQVSAHPVGGTVQEDSKNSRLDRYVERDSAEDRVALKRRIIEEMELEMALRPASEGELATQMMTWESGKRDFLEVGEQEAAAVGPARRSDAICWDV